MSRPCAALLEWKWWGHHPTYLKLFAELLLDLGCDVLCACPAPGEVEKWLEERRRPHWGRFVAEPLTMPRFAVHKRAWNPYWWLSARRAVERLRRASGLTPDWVFIPMADNLVESRLPPRLLDRLFPYDWSGCVMHPAWYFRSDAWKRQLTAARTNHCKRLYFLDDAIAADAERAWGKPSEPFPEYSFAEPNNDRDSALARAIREKAAGRRIVGLFGILDRRKGIHTMLAVARQMRSEPVLFAVVGHAHSAEADADVRSLEASLSPEDRQNVLLMHGKRVEDEEEFNALMETADVVFAVYENFPYASGILNKAAALGRPLVVASGGVMERRVKRFGLGLSVTPGDIEGAANAIRELLAHPPADTGQREYARLHSLDALRTLFEREMR